MAPSSIGSVVTGGAGFIGCNLADRLAQDGERVLVLDNLSREGAASNLAWLRRRHPDHISFLRGDVRCYETVVEAIGDANNVYHLAGQTAVTRSVEDPRRDFEDNALGTLNVLEAARLRSRPPIILYSSTNKVYGRLEDVLTREEPTRHIFADLIEGINEEQSLDLHSPYGCSKGSADQYVRDYARIFGLPTIVFRQSCIYGPRQMGIEDQGWVAWFIIALVTRKPITIFGDGKQVRDLLYVDDLISAYRLAVERIQTTAGQVYNIGGARQNTLSVWQEFGPLLRELLSGPIPEPHRAPWRPGDQPVFYSDISKAKRDFEWQPTTSVDDGLSMLTDWIKEQYHVLATHIGS